MKKEWNKRFLQNGEVSDWLLQLSERAKNNNIGEIHGSHDYRMKNIFGVLPIGWNELCKRQKSDRFSLTKRCLPLINRGCRTKGSPGLLL